MQNFHSLWSFIFAVWSAHKGWVLVQFKVTERLASFDVLVNFGSYTFVPRANVDSI